MVFLKKQLFSGYLKEKKAKGSVDQALAIDPTNNLGLTVKKDIEKQL